MSYCRFSTDDFRCDLYCINDVRGGYTTYVAGNRVRFDNPLPKPQSMEDIKAWARRYKKVIRILNRSAKEPIGGPHDGEIFNDATIEEFYDRLVYLRSVGYRFPDYVLETVKEEMEGEER